MKIEGKVATVIFRNETNGWTVLLLKVGNEYITAVGETTGIEVEDDIELDGIEDTHKVYGKQFKFTTYKKMLPKTNAALISYIADNVKGIGKKTATNIVQAFEENTVDVIRYSPSKLNDIKGLNPDKIVALNDFFNNEWDKWNSISYLSDFNVSVMVASKIYQVLGSETIKIVKENPYSLIGFVNTLDFKLVDEIGIKLGLPLDSDDRIDTGILFALNQVTEFGHTCIELDNLVTFASKILVVDGENIRNGLTRLKMQNKIYIQEIDNEEFVFRKGYYLAEDNIATSVIQHTMQNINNKNYDELIETVSEKNSLVLSEEQHTAISTCLNNSLSVITGGPGTGKTTIIKCIIDILEMIGKEYMLCAPTGRAAKRITETTGKEAKTLHRLLEIVKVDDNDIESFFETIVKPVETDVIIIDESSMIDCMMMSNFFKAVKPSTQVIMVGDVDQLPSVGAGNVLKDIISSQVVNVVCLKHIYRQSAKSDIVVNAHMVNNGEYPVFKSNDTDLYFIKSDSIQNTITEISSLVSYRLDTYAKLDTTKDLQILTPMKKTELGTVQLNPILQELLNPKSASKKEKEFGNKVFREGDKVMQIINNYDKKFSVDGNHFEGIFNGDIGYIETINTVEEKLMILFDDDRLVEYDFDEIEQLEHAYAVTIHKSQGSEFDYVILPLFTGYQKLFTRNLLYTAMTRAKKMLVIVGSKNVINYMVDNMESKNRKTGLKQKILEKL